MGAKNTLTEEMKQCHNAAIEPLRHQVIPRPSNSPGLAPCEFSFCFPNINDILKVRQSTILMRKSMPKSNGGLLLKMNNHLGLSKFDKHYLTIIWTVLQNLLSVGSNASTASHVDN